MCVFGDVCDVCVFGGVLCACMGKMCRYLAHVYVTNMLSFNAIT